MAMLNNQMVRGTWWSTTVADFGVVDFQPNLLYIKLGAWHLTLVNVGSRLLRVQQRQIAHTHRHRIHSGPLLGHAEFNQTHLLSVKFPCLFSSFFWGLRLYILKRYPTGGNLNSRTAILFGWFLKKLASNMTFIAAQGAALLMRWRTLTWPGEKFPKSSNRGYSWPSQIARG